MEPEFVNQIPEIIKASGELHNINHEIKNLPVGSHGGILGEISNNYFHETFKTFLPRVANHVGIRARDIDSTINSIMEELNESEFYVPVHRIYGQKRDEQNSSDI